MSWRDEAACTALPKVLFYPPLFKKERTAPEAAYYNLGKLACAVCPVRRECLHDGDQEEFGLWGGKTPRERQGKNIKEPSRLLPPNLVRLLASMGDDPDIPALKERIAPFLEKS